MSKVDTSTNFISKDGRYFKNPTLAANHNMCLEMLDLIRAQDDVYLNGAAHQIALFIVENCEYITAATDERGSALAAFPSAPPMQKPFVQKQAIPWNPETQPKAVPPLDEAALEADISSQLARR